MSITIFKIEHFKYKIIITVSSLQSMPRSGRTYLIFNRKYPTGDLYIQIYISYTSYRYNRVNYYWNFKFDFKFKLKHVIR